MPTAAGHATGKAVPNAQHMTVTRGELVTGVGVGVVAVGALGSLARMAGGLTEREAMNRSRLLEAPLWCRRRMLPVTVTLPPPAECTAQMHQM